MCRKLQKRQFPLPTPVNGVRNNGFVPETELNEGKSFSDASIEMTKSESSLNNAIVLNQNEIIPQHAEMRTFETESVEFELEEVAKRPIQEFESMEIFTGIKVLQRANSLQMDQLKLNDITSVDDIKDICVERHEPNGNAYFVEVNSIADSAGNEMNKFVQFDLNQSDSSQCDETSEVDKEEIEKNTVERVLNQSDVELNPKSKPEPVILTVPSESIEEKKVHAIVHATNEHQTQFEDASENSTPNSVIEQNSPKFELLTPIESKTVQQKPNEHSTPTEHSTLTTYSIQNEIVTHPVVMRSIKSGEKHAQSPNFKIGVYEALPKQKLLYENDKERLAFKMRLENLFGQNEETIVKNRAKSNFNSPTTPHSMCLRSWRHSLSAPESLHIELNEPVIQAKVPIPPAFNQELYSTIGRRNRKVLSSTSDVIEVNGSENNRMPTESVGQAVKLSRTKAHENLTELNDENDIATNIKQKLEEIFSKGRKMQQQQQQKHNDDDDETMDMPANRNNNRRSKRFEPFDTVRKQKILFSDVLKSIGPDIHVNLHSTHTAASNDKHKAEHRESLD